ncbi:hypothetical protein SAMN00017405_0879 [Desulfonispora thiosulfatigenes DSM 11270]|uniref:Uncharacterized protein n=1 Tax=Desulfonispora thiosulfatigenes DSM 11270 TaxID=656914 RepID=A0A1W1UHF6_DESTI|nr:hypothetical protein [Desulfonispora thiosulfatigenes]SMB80463.1 hypothetical protein SAMN00017405_0879 [Desulfonispora thiosulfatigenes DSM 11270]
MSVLGLLLTFIIGILMLAIGKIVKKKWLMMISIFPLAIVLYSIVLLVGMSL